MNKVEQTYFTFLRQAIGWADYVANSLLAISSTELHALLRLAECQGTGPLVFNLVLKLNHLPIEQELANRLKQHCLTNMLHQEEMLSILKKAWKALTQPTNTTSSFPAGERVETCLLKGFGLASLYPQPHLRQWGDIDIYVGPEGYHQGAEILRNTFPNTPCFEREEDFYKHWNMDIGHTAIEMHRVTAILLHPRDNRLWQRLEHEAISSHSINYADVDGLQVRVPEPNFNVLFVFLHSWQHFTESGSANMKQFCDLALLLKNVHTYSPKCSIPPIKNNNSYLTSYLKRNLRRLCLTSIWQQYAYIMVHYLGLPADECPLYTPRAAKCAENLLRLILDGQKKTKKPKHAPKNIILRKLCTLRNKLTDSLRLWSISPLYAIHDMNGKVLEGLSRLRHGDLTRKWE